MVHWLFGWPLPNALGPELQAVVHQVRSAADQDDALFRAYDLVSRRFTAGRLNTYKLFWRLFWKKLDTMWAKRGFIHCTHLNHFVRVLLVRSGWFDDADVRLRWTQISGWSPHQYLQVRMKDGRTVDVDPWGRSYGIPFGKHGKGFTATTFPIWRGS